MKKKSRFSFVIAIVKESASKGICINGMCSNSCFFHFTLLFPHPKMHTLLNSNCHFFQGLKYITWFLLLIMLIVAVVEKSLPYWKFTKVSFWDWGGWLVVVVGWEQSLFKNCHFIPYPQLFIMICAQQPKPNDSFIGIKSLSLPVAMLSTLTQQLSKLSVKLMLSKAFSITRNILVFLCFSGGTVALS